MKRFVVLLLTTLLTSALVATADGMEQGGKNALERLADRRAAARQVERINENDPAAIAKLIEDINAAARTNKQRILSIIVINTDVAASTLEQEKARTGMTIGDIYVAHSLSLATRKKFDTIVAMHKSGKSWAQIAKSHNVTLKGSRELIKEMLKQ
jgi:PIN domain nuclease of toxin-antitoxin system